MANDPAFLFYPGDYLRDTQCLSEGAQVAYDRIMCEHMRNICITQAQLDFFTKRLNDDEKAEIKMVVVKTTGGFHIPWVTESIKKRREYSESRRKNKLSKGKSEPNTSSTYVQHMDNVIENENEIIIGLKKEYRISVKKTYANDKVKIIYDLSIFFANQMEQLEKAKWTNFNGFMEANPGRVFDNDDHVYNSFKQFSTSTPKVNGNHYEKFTLEDLNA